MPKAKDYEAAVVLYQEAVDLLAAMAYAGAAVYSNLSLATLRLGEPMEALAAAERCTGAHVGEGLLPQGRGALRAAQVRRGRRAYDGGLQHKAGDADLSFAARLAKEAAKGGVWFRQLKPGRDIAVSQPASQVEGLILAPPEMNNFIYLVGCCTTRVLLLRPGVGHERHRRYLRAPQDAPRRRDGHALPL